MGLAVATPPIAAISLDAAKRHLRIEHVEEDAYITDLIAVAQAGLDGPMGWLGRSIGLQTLELRAPSFDGFTGGGIVLPCGPVVAVESVVYVAADGTSATLDPAAYRIDDDALLSADGRMWPVTRLRSDAVRVRYRAGYPPTGDTPPKPTVPAPIRHAILLLVAHLYENRMASSPVSMSELPMGVEALLTPWRTWRA